MLLSAHYDLNFKNSGKTLDTPRLRQAGHLKKTERFCNQAKHITNKQNHFRNYIRIYLFIICTIQYRARKILHLTRKQHFLKKVKTMFDFNEKAWFYLNFLIRLPEPAVFGLS